MGCGSMAIHKTNPALLAAGLRAFFRVSVEWNLNEAEQIILLGSPSQSVFTRWRSDDVASGFPETLERVSLIIGIYKAIHTLLPDSARANQWMRAPNRAPIFSGGSPQSDAPGGHRRFASGEGVPRYSTPLIYRGRKMSFEPSKKDVAIISSGRFIWVERLRDAKQRCLCISRRLAPFLVFSNVRAATVPILAVEAVCRLLCRFQRYVGTR